MELTRFSSFDGIRGGNLSPVRWADLVHPELGSARASNLLARKNQANFGSAQSYQGRAGLLFN